MAVTIQPSSIDFGNVVKDVQSTYPITVDVTDNAAVNLSVGTPFTLDTSVITQPGRHTVTVRVTHDACETVTATLTATQASSTTNASVSAVVNDPISQSLDNAETYLLLQVPDFGDTTFNASSDHRPHIDGTSLTSFLRLGKFDYDAEPPAARWLLEQIPQGAPASNPHQKPDASSLAGTRTLADASAQIAGTMFVDDTRDHYVDVVTDASSPAADPFHGLTKTQRRDESNRLYSRGGWRDHSDGNRISTTFGDKVEVVRGNYKMIVMGRQNDPGNAMGWEASGAHIQDFAPGTMPGASFWLEWIDDPRYWAPVLTEAADGNPFSPPTVDTTAPQDSQGNQYSQRGLWLLVNTTENVYEYARNAGNFREEVWGDVNETYVGSENPPTSGAFATDQTTGTQGHEVPADIRIAGRSYDLPRQYIAPTHASAADKNGITPAWALDNAGMVRSNPHIIERTWAERIDSHTGSSARRIPAIHEETWASDVYSSTDVDGPIYETTTANSTEAHTTVSGHAKEVANLGSSESTTTVGVATEVTTADMMASVTMVKSMIAEATLVPVHFEGHAGVLHASIEAAALLFELFVGGQISIDLAAALEVSVVGHKEVDPKWQGFAGQDETVALEKKVNALLEDHNSLKWKHNALAAEMKAFNLRLL